MGARPGAICAEIESVDDESAQVSPAHPVMAAAGLFRRQGSILEVVSFCAAARL